MMPEIQQITSVNPKMKFVKPVVNTLWQPPQLKTVSGPADIVAG